MVDSESACTSQPLIARICNPVLSGRAASSAGRAPRSQCGGQEFDPLAVHQPTSRFIRSRTELSSGSLLAATCLQYRSHYWRTEMISILGWIVFGLIIGALAKLVMPGRDPGGIIVTMLLGIAGAVIGGFIGRAMGFYGPGESAGW